ncbi:MAG: IclR family transcriptional regulator [Sulfitobacter sp.]
MPKEETIDSEISMTFRKGLQLMAAFDGQDRQLTLSELAKKTGLNRSVARRLVRTLVQMGYLAEQGQRYEMTVCVMRMTRGFIDGRRIAQVIQPNLRKAAGQIGESLSFSLRDREDATYVAHAHLEGKFTLNTVAIGTHVPLHSTAAGHAILAHLDRADVLATLSEISPELDADLQLTRARGFAFNSGGFIHGVDSLAVPVFGPTRQIEGAVSMIFPTHTYDAAALPPNMLTLMQQCAVDIGATL